MNTKIVFLKNGPIVIDGDLELVDSNNNQLSVAGRMKVSLCRCGFSSQKPFCDGSHKKIEFNDENKARPQESAGPKHLSPSQE
jgi:CDGSH-type Zn-finger protein